MVAFNKRYIKPPLVKVPVPNSPPRICPNCGEAVHAFEAVMGQGRKRGAFYYDCASCRRSFRPSQVLG